MELKWLEDFLVLMETRSFSAAAARRHVSQPAFSRRIQALENWLGATLVDRAYKPLRPTAVATENEAEFRHVVASLYELRSRLRAEQSGELRVTLAVQHSLATYYLPSLIDGLARRGFEQTYRVRSANKNDCVVMFLRGEADFLMCYEAGDNPTEIPPTTARRKLLGAEQLMLVGAPDGSGAPRFGVGEGAHLPLIGYPQDSFFGELLWQTRMPEMMRRYRVETVCVSAFAFGIREMAIGGLGAAWLPRSLIADDLAKGRLAVIADVAPPYGMHIAVYAPRNPVRPGLDRIWDEIEGPTAMAI